MDEKQPEWMNCEVQITYLASSVAGASAWGRHQALAAALDLLESATESTVRAWAVSA